MMKYPPVETLISHCINRARAAAHEDPTPGEFISACPVCGEDGLYVVLATFNGQRIPTSLHSKLERDGFYYDRETDPSVRDNGGNSTEDEEVRCEHCSVQYALSDLLVE